jgi:hypothetical protein
VGFEAVFQVGFSIRAEFFKTKPLWKIRTKKPRLTGRPWSLLAGRPFCRRIYKTNPFYLGSVIGCVKVALFLLTTSLFVGELRVIIDIFLYFI